MRAAAAADEGTRRPPRSVALLRGVNVGRAKRVAMADLRALFLRLGFDQPRTLLNSGNVVFGSAQAALAPAAAAALIEAALAEQLGLVSRVSVLDAARLDLLVEENPLAAGCADPARLMAFTLAGAREQALLAPLQAQPPAHWGQDRLHLGTVAAYVSCPGGVLDSKLAMTVSKLLGDSSTARNWNTILKLQALTAAA